MIIMTPARTNHEYQRATPTNSLHKLFKLLPPPIVMHRPQQRVWGQVCSKAFVSFHLPASGSLSRAFLFYFGALICRSRENTVGSVVFSESCSWKYLLCVLNVIYLWSYRDCWYFSLSYWMSRWSSPVLFINYYWHYFSIIGFIVVTMFINIVTILMFIILTILIMIMKVMIITVINIIMI